MKEQRERMKASVERSDLLIKIFPGSTIVSYANKGNGKQLGCIAKIQDAGGAQKIFFVKTYSNGTRQDETFARCCKPPLHELLIYKTLERSGFGPKCFFISDQSDYYVATQDIKYSKKHLEGDKTFTLFCDKGFPQKKLSFMHDLLSLDLICKIMGCTI
ncbi:hypothetical protein [Legionella rowbothamii]|uniref:hypothetical protein n=1 Tax=Legionella rowbothamii TaxID=96229 RepID=UPI001056D37E|nr:hypothetical protein [Legionella rowbothamii]